MAFNQRPVDALDRGQGVRRQVRHVHPGKGVELLVLKGLDARGKGHAQQVRDGKVDFGKAVRIGAVNRRLDHVVVQDAVHQVGRLALGGADGDGVKQPVPVVEEAIRDNPFFLPEVLIGVRGVNGIDGHVVLLAIGGGVRLVGVALEQAADGQLAGEGHHRVVGPAQVLEREVPVDRVF